MIRVLGGKSPLENVRKHVDTTLLGLISRAGGKRGGRHMVGRASAHQKCVAAVAS